MSHRFAIKEIAAQSGLSTATIDRALNGRAHVSPQTKARVAAAMDELQAQEAQLVARGRRLFVDVVIEAPERFSREIRAATEAVLPLMSPAVIRPRFTLREQMSDADYAAVFARILKRGGQGVLLKARDTQQVRAEVAKLAARGMPVVTLFTDLPGSARQAYCGLDNASAGRTAAWLLNKMMSFACGPVLTTQSQTAFQGEDARYQAFCAEITRLRPDVPVLDASGGAGLNTSTGQLVAGALSGQVRLGGVYSIGGGNRAVLAALDQFGLRPEAYIAHDLDKDNRDLLRLGRLDVVLQHDLAQDMAQAFRHIMAAHRLIAPLAGNLVSDVRVITPMNMPAE